MIPLPVECRAEFHPGFLTAGEQDEVYTYLDAIADLKDRRVRLADGTEHMTDVGSYILADADLLGLDKLPAVWGGRAAWPECLAAIKPRVEEVAGRSFQVCRCIYYESGERGVDFHVDLPAYGDTSVIASLSLGAEREFTLRRRDDPENRFSLLLPSGSLVILGEGCQDRYEHALLRDPARQGPRFNLTFRMYGFGH